MNMFPIISIVFLTLLFVVLLAVGIWGIIVQSRASNIAQSITAKEIPTQQEFIRDSIEKQTQSLEMQRETNILLKKILDAIETRPSA